MKVLITLHSTRHCISMQCIPDRTRLKHECVGLEPFSGFSIVGHKEGPTYYPPPPPPPPIKQATTMVLSVAMVAIRFNKVLELL